MALSVEQAQAALGAQQGVAPGAVNINDAIAYMNQANAAAFFNQPAPAASTSASTFTPTSAAGPVFGYESQPASTTPNYQNIVEQAYSNIGRSGFTSAPTAIDKSGFDYWTGQLTSGAISPDQFKSAFLAAAAPDVVNRAYQQALGRSPEEQGLGYYASQLTSGAISPTDLARVIASGATGTDQPAGLGYLQKLSEQNVKNLYSNILGREADTKGLQHYVDLFGPEISKQELEQFVYSAAPELASRAYKNVLGREGDPTGVEYYTGQLRSGALPYENLLQSVAYGAQGTDLPQAREYLTFGSGSFLENFEKERQNIEKALGLQPGTLATQIDPTKLAGKSQAEIDDLYQKSGANRYQEAINVSNLAKTVYGLSNDDAKKLGLDLLKGTSKDENANKIYNDLLKFGYTPEVKKEVLKDAAIRSPNSQYFKDNPDLLTIYKPLEEKTGSTGQFGYINNAPILNANFADEKLGGKNLVNPEIGGDSKLGWTTNSKYTEAIRRGPAIYGVEFSNRADIEKAIDIEKLYRDGELYQDYETGKFLTYSGNEVVDVPRSDDTRREYTPQFGNTLAKLQDAAKQVGLDPTRYESAGDLFDALQDKTKNFYQVTGRAIDWDPEVAKKLGITQTTSGRGGVNQASVIYQKVDDKLIPMPGLAKAFEFHDPNTSRGFIGDIAQDIARVPFVAELALATPAAPYYPLIKGAQTLALGGTPEQAFKAAGLAYLSQQFIPKYITPELQLSIAQNPIVANLAQSNPGLANFVIQSGSRAVISAGMAALIDRDPMQAALDSLASSGVVSLTNTGVEMSGIPKEYRSIVSNILTDAILGKDPKSSLTGAATNLIMNEFKEYKKDLINSNQIKGLTAETKT
jgi:hypothetical protein